MPRVAAPAHEADVNRHADDQSLVERMLCADKAAWQQFVTRYGRVVRARVADVAATFGRLRDDSAIDDATAEVFATLLNNDGAALRAFAGRSSLATYVAVIATRVAMRGFATHSRHAAQPADELVDGLTDERSHDPMRQLLLAEEHLRVQTLLRQLPTRQRQVVQMFHMEGETYARISEQLDMPMGSIGVTLRRAEARLRQWMETD